MGFKRLYQLGIFIVLDTLFTFLSLGFFGPSLKFDVHIIYQKLFLVDGYSFTKSPFELISLFFIRMILLIISAILIINKKDPIIKTLNVPCLGFSIVSVSYTIIKLLAFSENEALLYYPGLWFLVSWSWLVSPLFCAFWFFGLSKSADNYTRLFNPDEEQPQDNQTEVEGNETETEESKKKAKRPTWKHVKRLFTFSFIQWRWFLTGLFFLLAYSGVRIFIPYYTGVIIANVVNNKGHYELFKSVGIMAGLTLASTILGGCRGGSFDYATSLVGRRVRKDLFASLVKQEIGFFDVTKTGDLVSRLTADCSSISDSIALNINVFSRNAVMLMGALFFMFSISWRLALVTFIAIPVISYFSKVFGALFDKLGETMQTTIANANQTAEEVLSTMRTVRSFACENEEAARFDSMLNETLNIGKKKAIANVGNTCMAEFSTSAVLVAVLGYGGHLVLTQILSSESFISFIFYQIQLGENLMYISWVISGIMTSVGASRKVFEYIDRSPKIPNDGECNTNVKGDIKIDNISFVYPSRPNTTVLKGLSLDIKSGETIALVGPSGGGKSSIVQLVEHFYEPDEGEITVDGVDIRDYDHKHYHQKVALVAQEPVLYDGTVSDNIAYGFDGATKEMIEEAAKASNAHNFVMEMEKRYDTKCGERGVQMSGGQKQRIAIARALIRKPSILILDEATSALDNESESLVQEAINKCSVGLGLTVLIIAHRLSTIEKADRIAVIDKGEVVQIGSHPELMEDTNGLYNSLVNRQIMDGV
ncbi:hypothetical protein PFISCL1PPCAC_14635 [Pristionchus fissidentatus]|uniref:ABC transporter ATP-binding protein n=1 Tax=Pristionchus fissidentatus TaxID=1538716 RepID=A0AAV5VYM7_9BILA|nr:hypothetical protein PFISCL1PPCAC_14635 [Pristionchus fissidentatus]